MSSFADKFNVILVETESGKQRLIWRGLSDMKVYEVFLEPKSFEDIADQFLLWAEYQISSLSGLDVDQKHEKIL